MTFTKNDQICKPPLKTTESANLQRPQHSLSCGRHKCIACYGSFTGHLYFPSPGPCQELLAPAPATVSGLLFVFPALGSQFVFHGPCPKFVFPGPGPKFVFFSPSITLMFNSRVYFGTVLDLS